MISEPSVCAPLEIGQVHVDNLARFARYPEHLLGRARLATKKGLIVGGRGLHGHDHRSGGADRERDECPSRLIWANLHESLLRHHDFLALGDVIPDCFFAHCYSPVTRLCQKTVVRFTKVVTPRGKRMALDAGLGAAHAGSAFLSG